MQNIVIRQIPGEDEAIANFIRDTFSAHSAQHGVEQNFERFCFAAYGEDGSIAGVIDGQALFDEVYIDELVVAESMRGTGLGSRLVRTVEDHYRPLGFKFVALTTFEFQAPGFYKKLGYEVEFVRRAEDSRLDKYFFRKKL
ncbi:MAG: GNAT family N-acetyltransferase [Firmicutes bacterium]|nr:GNAT family N-acetyltransferase [Bacillota bacterium]